MGIQWELRTLEWGNNFELFSIFLPDSDSLKEPENLDDEEQLKHIQISKNHCRLQIPTLTNSTQRIQRYSRAADCVCPPGENFFSIFIDWDNFARPESVEYWTLFKKKSIFQVRKETLDHRWASFSSALLVLWPYSSLALPFPKFWMSNCSDSFSSLSSQSRIPP